MPNYKKLPAESNHFNGQLYQRMLEDLQLAGLAVRTIYELEAITNQFDQPIYRRGQSPRGPP